MKRSFSALFITTMLVVAANSALAQADPNAQMDEKTVRAELIKHTRPSPSETASQELSSGAKITIDYCSPSVKGRAIGKDVEPKDGQVWRAGANEATVFSTDRDITVNGKSLPAGKYTFFTLKNGNNWTLIFNKVLVQPDGKPTWGAYSYEKDKAQDVLKVTVKGKKAPIFFERLLYNINKNGNVSLLWGDQWVSFHIN
ncbi:MAG: DUF2911 domain-containing protein [Chitinophagaceae bacterium]|nr:DUF2911 domain-containing protein [Chitinophagaceae bacterium]